MSTYKTGDIVKLKESSACYKVIEVRSEYLIVKRVRKQRGWPLAERKKDLRFESEKLELVERGQKVPTYEEFSYGTSEQIKALSEEIVEKLKKLYSDLSPENLFCDGEISASEAIGRSMVIEKKIRDIEKEIGFKITDRRLYRERG